MSTLTDTQYTTRTRPSAPHYRRPGISPEDGYFASRYIGATVTLELEANLAEQLTAAAAEEERQALATAHSSAAAAAATSAAVNEAGGGGAGGRGGGGGAWRPGLPPVLLYGELLLRSGGGSSHKRALMQEGGMLPGVGAAAAALPGLIRRVVAELADVHQVCVCVYVWAQREGKGGGHGGRIFLTRTYKNTKPPRKRTPAKLLPPLQSSLLSCGMTPSCPSCGAQ